MDRSDVQETLVHLYLRLNGYFVSGFIVHAPYGATTELDVLAVRFPQHEEPAREIACSPHLAIPADRIDFVVGEVKGGTTNVNFNAQFRGNQAAVRSVLQRFGAFSGSEIDRMVAAVPNLLDPARLRQAGSFPSIEVSVWPDASAGRATLRFVPFATEQIRASAAVRPYIFQDDMIDFAWDCFRPEQQRLSCDVRYNFNLWGAQFVEMVRCFKDADRAMPPTLADVYAAYDL